MQAVKMPSAEQFQAVKSSLFKFSLTTLWGLVVIVFGVAALVYDVITSGFSGFVSSLITMAIVCAILFMMGDLIITTILELKNKFKTDYTPEYFKQERLKSGKTEEMTDEEEKHLQVIMEQAEQAWTLKIESEDGDLLMPANAKEIKNSEKLCKEIIAAAPTRPEVIELLNEWLVAENEARKRVFTGSYKLIALAVAVGFFLIFVIAPTPKQDLGMAFAFFWLPAAVYYFASRTPYYVAAQRSTAQVASGIVAGAFAVLGSGAIIKTKWSDGSTSEDSSGFWMSWVIGFFLLLACSLLVFPMACINYVRNYVLNI